MKEQINVVLQQNREGIIYGITFVDFSSKVVFNGSDLGKAYSDKAILHRLSMDSKTPHLTLAGEKKELQGQREVSRD